RRCAHPHSPLIVEVVVRSILFVVIAALASCTSSPNPGVDAPPAPACAPATGSGTMHPSPISQPETSSAADSPHVIASDLDISAPVTIEAGAVVQLAPGTTITVHTGGSVVAQGTDAGPVVFQPRDAGQPWAQLRTIGGTLSFTHTQLLGGGARGNALVDIAAV